VAGLTRKKIIIQIIRGELAVCILSNVGCEYKLLTLCPTEKIKATTSICRFYQMERELVLTGKAFSARINPVLGSQQILSFVG
jgi:hypothetical protein